MSKIILIGAAPESIVNFRGDLIQSLVTAGHEVIAMAAKTDNDTLRRINKTGASFRSYTVQRNGMNPIHDLRTFLSLRQTLNEIKPHIVLAYTIKPVIWGALAIQTININVRFYALITGLGYAFQKGSGKQNLLNQLVIRLYRLALLKAKTVIFQNKDNKQVFLDQRIVDEKKAVIVNGSGINTSYYVYSDLPQGKFAFLLIARLLGDKGIREYVKAAEVVSKKYPDVNFYLLGPPDPSPDCIPASEIENWQATGTINYLGSANDVRPFIEQCHVYVLPSYHEGMPRTVLEAMSMGRPILTTDVSGCRETVVSGENGFLVPARNAAALAEKMIWFIENREKMELMGKKSRKIAEEKYDVKMINADMLRVMGLKK